MVGLSFAYRDQSGTEDWEVALGKMTDTAIAIPSLITKTTISFHQNQSGNQFVCTHWTEFFLASSKLMERLTVPLPKLTLGF